MFWLPIEEHLIVSQCVVSNYKFNFCLQLYKSIPNQDRIGRS